MLTICFSLFVHRNGMLVDVESLPEPLKQDANSAVASTNTSLSTSTDIDTDESVEIEVKA